MADASYDPDEYFGDCTSSPRGSDVYSSFSRASSSNSIDNLFTSSSAQNTDDEDSDMDTGDGTKSSTNAIYKERRREAHTQAEQKRRDAIKRGYDDLQGLVPSCQASEFGATAGATAVKMSKAVVLQKSIEYIMQLQQQKRKQEDELNALRKEVIALEIMQKNYEDLVKVHRSHPINNASTVSDDTKFEMFQLICESLFKSFNQSVRTENFQALSGSFFAWLEEHCKPSELRAIVQQAGGHVAVTENKTFIGGGL